MLLCEMWSNRVGHGLALTLMLRELPTTLPRMGMYVNVGIHV